jgi:hypothetical protein
VQFHDLPGKQRHSSGTTMPQNSDLHFPLQTNHLFLLELIVDITFDGLPWLIGTRLAAIIENQNGRRWTPHASRATPANHAITQSRNKSTLADENSELQKMSKCKRQ